MTRADKALLLVILVLLPLLYVYTWQNRQAGSSIIIWSEQHGKQEISLADDRVIHVQGKLGKSRIEIKNGMARFIHSPCSGKQCIQHGWVKHQGDFVACLPNRVSVEVHSEHQRFDAVNF